MSRYIIHPREDGGCVVSTSPGGSFSMMPTDGSLGRSLGQQLWRFGTEDLGRQWVSMKTLQDDLEHKLGMALSEISYLKTTHGANENLRLVRAKRKAEAPR